MAPNSCRSHNTRSSRYYRVMKRLILLAVWFGLLAATDRYQAERERMVRDQIEALGISRPDVLRAIRSTPRHLFVPELLRPQAYDDHALPIGSGQTISQPYIVALMTELLEPSKQQKVLEIGTGSGYQAAVLAALVGHVYSIEIVPELAQSAAAVLKSVGVRNVTVRCGDGYQGWTEKAPFDRIVLTAAPPEIPESLVDQLKPGGRMVAPVGDSPFSQSLVVINKLADGTVRRRSVIPVAFVPMVREKP
jgi:protein-L-isoaspartate(D-aspartate) O-methyltransferase